MNEAVIEYTKEQPEWLPTELSDRSYHVNADEK